MIQIIELKGTEKRLYQLVAPLVMDPAVLKQNLNYPFRTSDNFVWFVALDGKDVTGFIPVENKMRESVINNYYIKDNNEEVLKKLLENVLAAAEEGKRLSSVTFIQHQAIFQEFGFIIEKVWTHYVKMSKDN